MANQNLNINIGTSFNGQGMSKALTAVDSLSKTTGKVAGAVGRLGGAFESLGGTAGKSIGAISGALGALATGGIFGAIIFAVTSIIQLFQKMGEDNSMDKLKENLSKVKENSEKVVSSMTGSLSKIDRYASSVDRLAAAYQRLAKAEAEAKTASLYEGIENMEEGPEKIIAQGNADLQAARISAETSNSVASARVSSADNKVTSINNKIKLVSDTIDLLNVDLGNYDKAVAEAGQKLYARQERGASKDEIEDAKEQLKLATKARNEFVTKTLNPAIQQKNELQDSLKTAQVERQAAEAERLNVEKDNAKKLEIAERAYKGALAEATDVKEAEIAEDERLVAEQKANAYRWERLQQLEKEVETTTKAVKDAQDDYTKALKRASDAARAAEIIADGGVWNPGGATPGGRDRGSGPASNNSDNPNWNVFGKPKGWDRRYWQTHPDEAAANGVQAGLSGNEQRNYDAMNRKLQNAGALTAEDRERVLGKKGAKEWEEYAKKDGELQAEIAKLKAEKAKNKLTDAQETAKNTKDIYDLLKNQLGLK